MREAIEKLEGQAGLERAHVADRRPERREPLEHPLEAREARVLVGVGTRPDVDHEHAVQRDEALVDRPHPRIVRVEALDLDVDLQTREPPRPARLVDDRPRIVVPCVDGAERDPVREPGRGVADPAIQVPGHPRPVGVREEREALDAGRAEGGHHLVRLGGAAEIPARVLLEPPPDRGEEPGRVEMRVRVDVAESGGRLHSRQGRRERRV